MNEDYIIIGKILAKYPELSQDDQFILDQWLKDDGNRQIFELLADRQEIVQNLKKYYEIIDQMRECKKRFDACTKTTLHRDFTIKQTFINGMINLFKISVEGSK